MTSSMVPPVADHPIAISISAPLATGNQVVENLGSLITLDALEKHYATIAHGDPLSDAELRRFLVSLGGAAFSGWWRNFLTRRGVYPFSASPDYSAFLTLRPRGKKFAYQTKRYPALYGRVYPARPVAATGHLLAENSAIRPASHS